MNADKNASERIDEQMPQKPPRSESIYLPQLERVTRSKMMVGCYNFLSDRRYLLPSTALLRTVRATFTAYGSSLH